MKLHSWQTKVFSFFFFFCWGRCNVASGKERQSQKILRNSQERWAKKNRIVLTMKLHSWQTKVFSFFFCWGRCNVASGKERQCQNILMNSFRACQQKLIWVCVCFCWGRYNVASGKERRNQNIVKNSFLECHNILMNWTHFLCVCVKKKLVFHQHLCRWKSLRFQSCC